MCDICKFLATEDIRFTSSPGRERSRSKASCHGQSEADQKQYVVNKFHRPWLV